jgi:hypothetical protein
MVGSLMRIYCSSMAILEEEAQEFSYAFIFDLEFRYAVLSRGMHHKEF